MRSPINPVALGVGLAVVVVGVAGVLFLNRGSHIELKGTILKVRTLAVEEASSIAVLDFRFANPSNYPFVVKQVDIAIETKDGKRLEGERVSEVDARRLFEYYPLLGQKFNDTLLMRDKIPGRQSMDRMIAARFEAPESVIQNRKRMVIRIEDVDGPVAELEENGPGSR
ncbi:MAG: hypothetical protein ABIZ80_11155 [Bryobacteraceae bacterium]